MGLVIDVRCGQACKQRQSAELGSRRGFCDDRAVQCQAGSLHTVIPSLSCCVCCSFLALRARTKAAMAAKATSGSALGGSLRRGWRVPAAAVMSGCLNTARQ